MNEVLVAAGLGFLAAGVPAVLIIIVLLYLWRLRPPPLDEAPPPAPPLWTPLPHVHDFPPELSPDEIAALEREDEFIEHRKNRCRDIEPALERWQDINR